MKKNYSLFFSILALACLLSGCTAAGSSSVTVTYKFPDVVVVCPVQDGTNGTSSKYIYFGKVPQTKKSDSVTIIENSNQEGSKYYTGDDGEQYYKSGDEYYKVEPIKWRVLNDNYKTTGKALLLSEKVIMGESAFFYYDDTDEYPSRTIEGETVYQNNYQYSAVNAILNGTSIILEDGTVDDSCKDAGYLRFFFSDEEQKYIALTEIDNSIETTYDFQKAQAETAGYNNCNSFEAKLFLLSVNDATNPNYGFKDLEDYGKDCNRVKDATDYAIAWKVSGYEDEDEGYTGYYWALRSPCLGSTTTRRYVENDGCPWGSAEVTNDEIGIAPSLYLQLVQE